MKKLAIIISLFLSGFFVTTPYVLAYDVQPTHSSDLNGSWITSTSTGVTGVFNQIYFWRGTTGTGGTSVPFSFSIGNGVSTTTYSTDVNGTLGRIAGGIEYQCLHLSGTYATSTVNVSPSQLIEVAFNSYSVPFYGQIYGDTPNGHIAWGLRYNEPCNSSQYEGSFYSSGQLVSSIIASSTTISGNLGGGGLSTTTSATYCDTNLPFDDSTIIKATLTYVPNGLCRVGLFLVIPTSDSLNQFSTLASYTKNRFPFSYIASVTDTWSTLTASSTANAPVYAFPLHDAGIGSTSALGNILPNVTVFSSSTVEQYFPSGMFQLLKTLAGIALVLTLVADIFFTSRNMIKS